MKLKTVKFDSYDSYTDWGLLLTAQTVGEAAVKTNTVEVPGADGELDLTDYFGELFYENREIKLEFATVAAMSEFKEIYSKVKNALNGRKMKITISDEADYYYVGRVSVGEWASDGVIGSISVTCDCEPYKYKTDLTTHEITLTGEAQAVEFENLNKRVMPEFNFTEAGVQLQFENSSYSASQGAWSDPRLKFKMGVNTVIFTGSGTVTVKYQERGF